MEIIAHFPQFTFLPAGYFAYDAAREIINYDQSRLRQNCGRLCLLHETAHALLGHVDYTSDIELFMMELAAWRKTSEIARQFAITLDQEYITDCLKSYERWLIARGTCPDCGNFCLNAAEHRFHCFVCGCDWSVNSGRDCAIRRRRITQRSAALQQNPA